VILDRLEQSGRYTKIHPLFSRAFDLLARTDLRSLPPGRHTIDGERLYLVIANEDGKGMDGAVLEAHRKYIDIQFVVEGTDMIGWRPAAECPGVIAPYDPSKDVELYGEKPHAWSRVTGSAFALYFPEDAHAPLGGTGILRKAIVKVGI
jgi:YhcH/YjgK/YiaL family protein